jgi:hypothetical protein
MPLFPATLRWALAGGDGFVSIYPYAAPAYTAYDARVAWAGRVGAAPWCPSMSSTSGRAIGGGRSLAAGRAGPLE